MHRSRADPVRHRRPSRWANIAVLVLLPLLLVACPTLDGPPAAVEVELRVSAQGSGRVHVNGASPTLPYEADYPQGTEITLRAEADDGHTFERWGGDASGATNPLTLTLADAQAIEAVFVAEPEPEPDPEPDPEPEPTVTLTVATDGNGSGHVTSIPDGIDCGTTCATTFAPGTRVTLTTTPDEGSIVTARTGCDTASDTTCTLDLDADRTVTVSFGQDDPPPAIEVALRVSARGSGRVHVNGASPTLPYEADYPQGTEITLRAEADDGHAFEGWGGDASGATNPLTLTLTEARDIAAVFVAEPPPATGAPAWHLADEAFVVTAAVGTAPPLNTTVRNDGDAEGTFTVASDRAWLSAEPTSGTLAPGAELALDLVAVCPSRGRETAVLTVQGDGASATLTVDRTCQAAEWSTNPESLVFSGSLVATDQAQPPSQTLTVTNAGTLAAMPTIESDAAWLGASVPASLVEPGSSANATVTVAACTEAGRTQATLTIAGGGDAATVVVERTCDAVEWSPDPTTVTLVGLSDGSPVPAGSFTLRNDGTVGATPTATARAGAPDWLLFGSASPGPVPVGATSSPLTVEVAPCSAFGIASTWIDVTGGNATASVQVVRDCREASPVGLSIDRFYVNQSVPAQDTLPGARDVPIVVGRDGLVRAFVTADAPGASGASVTLAYRCGSGGAEREVALAGPTQVPTSTVEGDRSTVYERRVDAATFCADVQVAVAATATGADGGRLGARWPASGFAPLTTTTPPATSFVLVPVALNGGAPPSIPSPAAYLADVRRAFPFGDGTITSIDVGASFAFTGDLTQGAAWSNLLGAITTIANDDPQGRHHIGVVTPPYDGGIAGIAWLGNGNPAYRAAVVWSKWGFAEVTAHELGHNWGRRHAPCGGVGDPDAAYPYDGGSIGVWGFDLVGDDLKDPVSHTDLMGYCSQTWVSDYTYAGIAAYRSQYGLSVRAASAPVPGLLVTGVVDRDTGILTLDPVFAIDARPDAVPPGPYLAVGIATDGTEAFRVPFGTREVSQHEVEPFRVFVPWRGAAPPPLARLRIERDGVVLVERVAGLRPSAVATVEAERTPDGRVRLSWPAAAYPWARVSDADDGTLLGVGQGGALLVAPVGPRLRVQLGDGLNTITVDVAY